MNKLKILVYEYVTFPVAEYIDVMSALGHNVEYIIKTGKDPNGFDDKFKTELQKKVDEFKPELIFSHNFFPYISNFCQEHNIIYAGWVSDNPLFTLYDKSVRNSCNHIFLFDKSQYEEFEKIGLKNIYYLPLSVDAERLDAITVTSEDVLKFSTEVSFVGKTYDDNGYNEIKTMSGYLKGYVDALIEAQLNTIGYNFMEEALSDYFVNEFSKLIYKKPNPVDKSPAEKRKMMGKFYLARKCTEVDRVRTLNFISEFSELTVFGNCGWKNINDQVIKKPNIDYLLEMPKVFKLSKININMTLKSILTGIPMRVFDIMGAGGFALSNYQAEMSELFEIGKDIEVYYDLQDLKEKIQYYLEHDNERKDIAYNGYMKVKTQHSMIKKLNYILKTVEKAVLEDSIHEDIVL